MKNVIFLFISFNLSLTLPVKQDDQGRAAKDPYSGTRLGYSLCSLKEVPTSVKIEHAVTPPKASMLSI